MDKKGYNLHMKQLEKELEEAHNRVFDLEDSISDLKNEYVTSLCPFNIGDRYSAGDGKLFELRNVEQIGDTDAFKMHSVRVQKNGKATKSWVEHVQSPVWQIVQHAGTQDDLVCEGDDQDQG